MTALDAFADRDAVRYAERFYTVQQVEGSFDAVELERSLQEAAFHGASGLVYGSGFETHPAMLEVAERYLPLIGNSLRVVRNMKRAITFFALLDVLNIPRPPVSLQQLGTAQLASGAWLVKRNGGSGGLHVRRACVDTVLMSNHYYQQAVQGLPVSLLFAADGINVREVGFNQQWLAPTAMLPYRYGGAVSHAAVPLAVKQQMLLAAQKLTKAVGLRGLNSLDAVMQGDRCWILEINPRLSATFDLYLTKEGQLFELHMRACAGDLGSPLVASQARAHYIVYAPENISIPLEFEWPDWVADIPNDGALIKAGEPVCTVTADAPESEVAVQLMAERVKTLVKELI